MTVTALAVSAEPILSIEADVLVLGVRKTDDGPMLLSDDPELQPIQLALESIGVTGEQDELRRLPAVHGATESLALIGVGSDEITAHTLRYASGSAARQLRGIESIVIGLPTETEDDVLAVLEGAAIGAYNYTEYRSSSLETTKLPAHNVVVASQIAWASGQTGTSAIVERARIVANAIHAVRDLVNMPPSDLYPETFALTTQSLAAGTPVQVTVLGEQELADGGFGGILGVGQGSTRGPRLVKVSYSPAGATKHIALVGKGITFDSGGLSLKRPESMIGMKYDMTGAATVLSVALAVAALGLTVRMTAWLCLAENLPSGSAVRPNDVLRLRGGKTVEVLNTDAEGRLVLADGLVAASEEKPDLIVDVATLTGSSVVALGNRYVGTMGSTALVSQLVDTAAGVGETLWPMPLPAELRPMLNSDIADIANVRPGSTAAGMLIAGIFLREFVGTTGEGDDKRSIPWAHLDIAGAANNGAAGWGYTGTGPTGVAVRTLIALAEEYSPA